MWGHNFKFSKCVWVTRIWRYCPKGIVHTTTNLWRRIPIGSATIPSGQYLPMRVNHTYLKNPRCENTREVTPLSTQIQVIHSHACTLEGIAPQRELHTQQQTCRGREDDSLRINNCNSLLGAIPLKCVWITRIWKTLSVKIHVRSHL